MGKKNATSEMEQEEKLQPSKSTWKRNISLLKSSGEYG